jgi:hypothetical protein
MDSHPWLGTAQDRRRANSLVLPGMLRSAQLRREALVWGAAMVWLGLFANLGQPGWSLCPLHALGLDVCPGCGLGRSIGFALRGQFAASWAMHPLGLFALTVLASRIFLLTFPGLRNRSQLLRNLFRPKLRRSTTR